jgi:3-methyladenine DNA glycosylase Tag
MKAEIFQQIDNIIEDIDKYKVEPVFSNEINLRNNKKVAEDLSENEIIEIFTNLIAYSQNANSKLVEEIIKSGILKEIFANYNIDQMIKMNPCDLADKYWGQIGGIRQQAKLFHIISLARKIKNIGSFSKLLTITEIPDKIKDENDIENFWIGFKKLKKVMDKNKVPFFRSTTSLLHFLLDTGYDCVKPDLVVMKVAKKIGIVEDEVGEKNLIQTVRTIQEYSLYKGIRPSIIDLYFLIDGGQLGAVKFVENEFYK